ncbi:MAG: SO_0444 family Cu/Zn efflux transporter [Desulfobulbaceae bacterium]|nr:SO_0444 family Cu/Zn efflux transporter [Desulfobulbaceae bacterium]
MQSAAELITDILTASLHMLQEASIYIVFGLVIGGMLKVFLSPAYVAAHLGEGRFKSVFKAALFGIPIPICSCGVLPAAAALKKQGANNGATSAFLISTPESGVDSISLSWALLDPLMTVFRPLSAFLSAFVAGSLENIMNPPGPREKLQPLLSCQVDNCCDGTGCSPEEHRKHHGFFEKTISGMRYALTELWGDLAVTFFIGVLLAGIISVLLPDSFFHTYLGGGLSSMLLMLVIGIPLYICATASTPIAAAFILKGVSPGAALVFLLVGPATNIASLSMLTGLLGKRATGLYLLSISVVSVLCGLVLDSFYLFFAISPQAVMGQAAEIIPLWLKTGGTFFLGVLSVLLLVGFLRKKWTKKPTTCDCGCGSQPVDLVTQIPASEGQGFSQEK